MSQLKDDGKPLFVQIKELIEDQIVKGQLNEGDQAPSTNQLVQFYKINHVTVAKGVNQLVDAGILYKQRGVGMFVAEGAKETLMKQRKEDFMDLYVMKIVEEADKIGLSEEELITLIKQARRNM
ncbi:DNA-binding transcriptional regulator YhcF (GntR family) [Alkalihalobacillus xiaoxiensis]|uniref:DNA-binding transcriptional regulator YhcF (GntR family) n=1 Tax=Shouchella xiaoxiensis TaxID=766895 RepID=A0ABS2T0F9_9BACI|nr:GntR family transcriptional regulator [Shouchella xiaoxiensis]MBM7841264.1 DNA-binding transcriptional regulator YhcF (GntR family) [Shouchella xiaoxiensis]